MDMSALITKMTIFVVLMVIGYVCVKIRYVGKDFARDASKLVINVFMTATILKPVMDPSLQLSGGELLRVMLVLCMCIFVCWIVAAVSCRLVRLDRQHEPLFELLLAVTNNMFIALPVVDAIFGSEAVFYCSLSCIPYNVLLYTYGVHRLKGSGQGSVRVRDIFSIPLIATFSALLIFVLRIPVPALVQELASAMAGATMPLSMIVIGASLGSVSLFDSFKNFKLYIMCALRLFLCPLIVWILGGLMGADYALRVSATIIAGSPSGVVVSVLTLQYDKDAVFTSQGILLSTVLSMLTIPVLVFLMG